MSKLKAGFSRVDITPWFGTKISGYFDERIADGIIDPLYMSCLAVSDGSNTVLLYSADVIGIRLDAVDAYRAKIAKATGVNPDGIVMCATHTHTSVILGEENGEQDDEYMEYFGRKLCDTARMAINDLSDTAIRIGKTEVKDVSFVRRFLMKSGKVQTNPGIGNPDIDHPIGTPDETLQVVRFIRDGKDEIIIANFQTHPDSVCGTKFSADYPGVVCNTVETALPNVKCMFINGCQGDVNHINVNRPVEPEDVCFDSVPRGKKYTNFMGRSIAGGVLAAYDNTVAVEGGKVAFMRCYADVEYNKADPADLPKMQRIRELYYGGRRDEIGEEQMELTTTIAEADRAIALKDYPDSINLPISGIAFGEIAFIGFPGEPFTDIGRGVKGNSPFKMTLTSCCSNGYEGYYPMQSAYDEGGYEARTARYRAGVAEKFIKTGLDVLNGMKK